MGAGTYRRGGWIMGGKGGLKKMLLDTPVTGGEKKGRGHVMFGTRL